MDKKPKPRGLGRGLSALMADVGESPANAPGYRTAERMIPIEKLIANPNQPRRRFAQEDLNDLSASIKEKGILQPLLVRAFGESFEIVAGERRWRAAQMANLHEVPVIVRDYTDTEVLEVAIIENIQRADLNPIEEAAGYKQLMERFGHTQEKLAEALGKSRSHIANLMRLLSLPDSVALHVQEGRLSAGHARALLMADDPVALADKVLKGGLSVRATEALVKSESSESKPVSAKPTADKDADTKALEGDLSAALGMKVQLNHKSGKEAGELSIRYKSLDELDTLCRLLSES
jgi:ParB family chromosome partitioning protein